MGMSAGKSHPGPLLAFRPLHTCHVLPGDPTPPTLAIMADVLALRDLVSLKPLIVKNVFP